MSTENPEKNPFAKNHESSKCIANKLRFRVFYTRLAKCICASFHRQIVSAHSRSMHFLVCAAGVYALAATGAEALAFGTNGLSVRGLPPALRNGRRVEDDGMHPLIRLRGSLKMVKNAEARKFWGTYFDEENYEVQWCDFAHALSREFAFAQSDLNRIGNVMGVDIENSSAVISVSDFNTLTVNDGLSRSLQKLVDAPLDFICQDSRNQYLKVASVSVALIALVRYWTFDGAMAGMAWIETYKAIYGRINFLDFCGSTVTIFNYRCEAERHIRAGDERLMRLYRSYIGFYAHTILKCNFLQFGGSAVTAILLGQAPRWLTDSSAFSAFLLAYWLVFCSPGDLWFKMLQQGLMVPMNIFNTVRVAHALSSWGVDKSLNAEHPKIRKSVWGALWCGFTSGCLSGMVAGVGEEGGAWFTAHTPTWFQQRTFYALMGYYFLTDPHGVLLNAYNHLGMYEFVGLPASSFIPCMSPMACKVFIVVVMLFLQFSRDFAGVDLLRPMNTALKGLLSMSFPIQMDRGHDPFSATRTPL